MGDPEQEPLSALTPPFSLLLPQLGHPTPPRPAPPGSPPGQKTVVVARTLGTESHGLDSSGTFYIRRAPLSDTVWSHMQAPCPRRLPTLPALGRQASRHPARGGAAPKECVQGGRPFPAAQAVSTPSCHHPVL